MMPVGNVARILCGHEEELWVGNNGNSGRALISNVVGIVGRIYIKNKRCHENLSPCPQKHQC